MNRKVIVVAQSRTTGRFLLSKQGDEWNWASSFIDDMNLPMLYHGLNNVKKLTGVDANNDDETFDGLQLEFVTSRPDQIFHLWMDGEPLISDQAQWVSLLGFPSNCHPDIEKVFGDSYFRSVTLRPNS